MIDTRKVDALVVETFGRRIAKLLQEKFMQLCGQIDDMGGAAADQQQQHLHPIDEEGPMMESGGVTTTSSRATTLNGGNNANRLPRPLQGNHTTYLDATMDSHVG